MTITIANLIKGGVGKTTLAVNLAAQFASSGAAVNIIDLDADQRAAYEWSEHRADLNGYVEPSTKVISNILEDKKSVNIFDTGGFDLVSTQALISASDVVLIPTSMSCIELDAFIKLVDKINKIKEIMQKDDLKIIVVPNRIHTAVSSTAIAENFKGIKALGYRLAPALRYRAAYQKTFSKGGSVLGSGDAKARTEIYNLYEFVKEALNG